MTRYLVAGGIVAFWLVMMSILIERDVLPAWVDAHRPVYRPASGKQEPPRRTQMGIFWRQARVGVHRSVVWRDTDGSLVMDGRTEMEAEVPVLRFRSRFEVTSRVRVAADGHLRSFLVDTTSDLGFDRTISGEVEGRSLVVAINTGQHTITRTFPFDPQDVLVHDLSPYEGLGDLRVGQQWFIQQVNPLGGDALPSLVPVEVREKHVLLWRGQPVETFVLVTTVGEMEARTWVRPNGEILRQELPLGLALELEPYEEPPPVAARPRRRREGPLP